MGKSKMLPYQGSGGYGWVDMGPKGLTKTMKTATFKLGQHIETLKPDALAFCGSSGAAFAFIAAVFYEMPLLYVRKANESSHGSKIECNTTGAVHSYLIVDDFIDTGRTMQYIVQSIGEHADQMNMTRPECLGAFLYAPYHQSKRFRVDDDFYDIFI